MSVHNSMTVNRSSLARRRRRDLGRTGWIQSIVGESKQIAKTLTGAAPGELRRLTDQLRRSVKDQNSLDDSRVLVTAAAAITEAIRQVHGIELFDVQLHAGLIVSRGAVAEMQTGEGKTYSIAMPAYYSALAGRGVHVATPNEYLAGRDHQKISPVLALLGMKTGLLKENAPPEEARAAYQADVTYGPGHAFGFDYLRDQLTLDKINQPQLGGRLYSRLCGDGPEDQLLQRGLFASIVDEVDHVLIDDAVSPLLLSGSSEGESPDAQVHREAKIVAEGLQLQQDVELVDHATLRLTNAGFERVYARASMAVHCQLARPWHEYVMLALRAMHAYRRDIDYVITDGQVQIVDASTGRIFKDRTWSEGLHQAIEARENLTISCETSPLASITRQRFFRYYQSLGGMTGTALGCEHEFAAVYGLPVHVVPLRLVTKRVLLPDSVSLTRQEKLAAIADETQSVTDAGRAVLIGTLNIAESIDVAEHLSRRGLSFQLLNGIQDADEAAIVAKAGEPKAITVATNLAGRGTDIALDPAVARSGGLHVIVTQRHSLTRVDRQLVGRCASMRRPRLGPFFCFSRRLAAARSRAMGPAGDPAMGQTRQTRKTVA